MKNVIVAALLLVLCVTTLQAQIPDPYKRDILGVRSSRTGTAWTARAYTASLSDTSQSVSPLGCDYLVFRLRSKDSCGVAVYYMPSWDNVTFGDMVYIDSLSTGNNAGGNKGFALPQQAMGCAGVKFVVLFNAVYNIGVSTATFDARITRKW